MLESLIATLDNANCAVTFYRDAANYTDFKQRWHCSISFENENVKLSVSKFASTMLEATQAAWDAIAPIVTQGAGRKFLGPLLEHRPRSLEQGNDWRDNCPF